MNKSYIKKVWTIFCLGIMVNCGLNAFGTFGGFSIEKELYDYICAVLEEGKTILELGSGFGTGELAKRYTMYSIEHDKRWLGKYESTYIYAPFINGWYDVNALMDQLPVEYDLILVDGPYWPEERFGFAAYFELFRQDVPIIFDDVNVKTVYDAMVVVSKKLGRPFSVFQTGPKRVGIIFTS